MDSRAVVPVNSPPEVDLEEHDHTLTFHYGVNAYFVYSFIKKYDISPEMTTRQVVQQIIVPETADLKSHYLVKIRHLKQFYSDLREGRRNTYVTRNVRSKYSAGRRSVTVHSATAYFLSHCWDMPFAHMATMLQIAGDDYKHAYFWIDIFCKNQHFASPDRTEFLIPIQDAGHVAIALWPAEKPIALRRIWCLFELWGAIDHQISIQATYQPAHRRQVMWQRLLSSKDIYNIDVSRAEATVATDVENILGDIATRPGLIQANEVINKWLNDSVESYLRRYLCAAGIVAVGVGYIALAVLLLIFVSQSAGIILIVIALALTAPFFIACETGVCNVCCWKSTQYEDYELKNAEEEEERNEQAREKNLSNSEAAEKDDVVVPDERRSLSSDLETENLEQGLSQKIHDVNKVAPRREE